MAIKEIAGKKQDMKMPDMFNVQAAPTAEAGAEAAASAAGDWRWAARTVKPVKHQTSVEIPQLFLGRFLYQVCIHFLFQTYRCMKNPEDNSHVISLKDARSHVDHLHFLDVLASRPSRPGKGPKGKAFGSLVLEAHQSPS